MKRLSVWVKDGPEQLTLPCLLYMNTEVNVVFDDPVCFWSCCSFVTVDLVILSFPSIFSQTSKGRIERTALATLRFIKLNGEGTTSPSCRSKPPKSMVLISSLAGVPVCSRPSLNPAALREAERPIEGASPSRPAGNRLRPEERVRTGK